MMHVKPHAGQSVPVVFAPYALDPDAGRTKMIVPAGASIANMVDAAMPDLPASVRERVYVRMVTAKGVATVPASNWHLVRPKATTQVIISLTPGKGVMQAVLSVAAIAAAFVFAPFLAGTLGINLMTAQAVIVAGVNLVGGLLLNALFSNGNKKDRPQYAITGWQNEARPEEPVPFPLGRVRHAPPFAASTYMEVVGELMWTRSIFCHGVGPLKLWDHKEGDDEIIADKNLQIEHRYGYPDDLSLSLYTTQVVEDRVGEALVWLFKRDDTGKQLKQMDDYEPVKRTTGRRCKRAVIVLRFGSGLGFIETQGTRKSYTSTYRLRYRAAGTNVWVNRPNVSITRKKFAELWYAIEIDFPAIGAYEIEVTRLDASELQEDSKKTLIGECTWVVLQTHREEYPINAGVPLALTAIRAKGTHKRSGMLDNYNCMVERETDGFGVGWPLGQASNPATSALSALMLDGGLVEPVPATDIDWEFFNEWREFCVEKGLKFDAASFEPRLADVLKIVGAAGRASIFFDGSKWTGIIDRPRSIPLDLITPQNADGFSHETAYFDLPDAFRVKFQDATNDFKPAERLVRRPGHIGTILRTEVIDMPGKTDPAEIYREAVRRFYELQFRNTVYKARMDDVKRSASRGDLVMSSVDTLRRAVASGMVVALRGRHIELNERVEFKAGVDYSIRWRKAKDADGKETGHEVRQLQTIAGESSAMVIKGTGSLPAVNDYVVIGETDKESIPLIITKVIRSKDLVSELIMLPAAEQIETLTDATTIPPWDGKIGDIIDLSGVAPRAPVITGVYSDIELNVSIIHLAPNRMDTIPIATFTLRHRAYGSPGWSPITVQAARAEATLSAYQQGDRVEVQASATSIYGAVGPWSDIQTIIIGEGTMVIGQLDFSDRANSGLIAVI